LNHRPRGYEPRSRKAAARWVRELERLKKRLLTPALEAEFLEWLVKSRGVSREWAGSVLRYLRKGLRPDQRNNVVAHRTFLHYAHERWGIDVSHLLERLRTRMATPDRYVPGEQEILESLERLKERSVKAYRVWLLALASGLRGREVCKILCEFDESRLSIRDGVCLYELTWLRGSKRAYHAFWPSWLEVERTGVSWQSLHTFSRRYGAVAIKYVRKFVAQRMIDLGLSPDIIDFIQGRTPVRHIILFTNYASLLGRATREYQSYADWLRRFLQPLLAHSGYQS